MAFAKITAPGLTYELTNHDVIVVARAAQYEGGFPEDVLWAYTQRFALRSSRQYASFAAMVEDHSQPINPKWRRDGVFCRSGGRYYGTDQCSEARLARRDRAASMRWEDLDLEIRQIVSSWAQGKLENSVPRAVDFAAPNVAQAYLNRTPTARLVKEAGNLYIATHESLDWPSDYVSMGPSSMLRRVFFGSAFALALAGGIYYFVQRGRR